jgi:hypothetical protein
MTIHQWTSEANTNVDVFHDSAWPNRTSQPTQPSSQCAGRCASDFCGIRVCLDVCLCYDFLEGNDGEFAENKETRVKSKSIWQFLSG